MAPNCATRPSKSRCRLIRFYASTKRTRCACDKLLPSGKEADPASKPSLLTQLPDFAKRLGVRQPSGALETHSTESRVFTILAPCLNTAFRGHMHLSINSRRRVPTL